MKKKQEEAKEFKKTQQTIIEGFTRDVENLFSSLNNRMREIKRCKSRLEIIALRSDSLSTVEYLDLMIQADDIERHLVSKQQIKMLKEYRQKTLFENDIGNFNEYFQSMQEQIASYGIALNQKDATKQEIDFIKHFWGLI